MTRTLSLAFTLCFVAISVGEAIPPIPRLLPPEGIEIPAEVGKRLEDGLAAAKKRFTSVEKHELSADVEIYLKAVDYALLHREFYGAKDFAKADAALAEANKRIDALAKNEAPWTKATGLVVRGYRSSIDGSAQPYGLVIPKDHDFQKSLPLYVWLHGRGDKNTDLHFIAERATKVGQIEPPGAIVVHPFGRHCVGFKHAGEIDVLEAAREVHRRYGTDKTRTVLMGFSMGGAGAWHIGAHYADDWIAVSPGAGFADVAKYQRLTPEKYPPWYEQTLWGAYDVPAYVRNLFNTQTIAYSGENDKQIQAARLMEDAFKSEGRTLTHLIGPGVEHKYEPKTLAELLRRVGEVVKPGQEKVPREVHLQTRTLRYNRQHWVSAIELEEHWKDSRIDAVMSNGKVDIRTFNIARIDLHLDFSDQDRFLKVFIDGLNMPKTDAVGAQYAKSGGRWAPAQEAPPIRSLQKLPQLQGPIDDAFLERFLVVVPTGKSKNPAFQAWVDFELAHFRDRWRALMRGELPTKNDRDIDAADIAANNLIVWGDPDSNSYLAGQLSKLPVKFDDGKWTLNGQTLDGNRQVPVLIYPHQTPNGRSRYIVLNSGLTFREAHDRTNSLQNPKLPDWAIIDITQPPDASAPGKVVAADFFDERWQFKAGK